MSRIKPWYQVITPREDLREGRPLDASEFAVHLDHVHEKRPGVHPDYVEPDRFFDRTYLTKSLRDLAAQVVRRLSGIRVETSAVFNMATQFGGGKTHALTALYHLANGGREAERWKGVREILSAADVSSVPNARVGVFVGTEFDALLGRSAEGEPTRLTPWGELAWQLGGEEGFSAVAEHDAQRIAPAGQVLRAMLPEGPTLLLLDELINYTSRGRKLGAGEQLFDFLQNLSEEARLRDNLVLCVSIPASELEMGPEDWREYESLKKLLDRVGRAVVMSAETEFGEIIRRRLFEWGGLPDEGRRTASVYAEWAQDHSSDTGFDASSIRDVFAQAYPFHPAVLSVFERKWQGLPRFQRTRGVLRLLALWISHAYQAGYQGGTREPLLTLGSAPLEDPLFRAALFEQLGSDRLEVPVITDIVGANAHAVRLDREAPEPTKKARLHQQIAKAIFFESNGGQSSTQAEATVPEVKAALGGPSVNLADVDQALDALATTCFYLTAARNRYRFSLQPNLNQMLSARRAEVRDEDVQGRIKEETDRLFRVKKDRAFEVYLFPERSNDVPDRPELALAVLGLDTPAGAPATQRLLETLVQESGAAPRTYKSGVLFAVPEAGSTAPDAARQLLAWEAINADSASKARLDEAQRRELDQGIRRAELDLREALFRTYRHLALLGRDGALRDIDLGQITSSMAGSLPELLLNRLIKDDEVTDGVGAHRMLKYWPPALEAWSTKAARDAFYASPLLPRLLHPDALRRTIADGVTQGLFGYARRGANGQITLVKFEAPLAESAVEFDEDVVLLQSEDARRLLDPPRVARLSLRPERVQLRPGEHVAFHVQAISQYGNPLTPSGVTWRAVGGGNVSEEGSFRAGDEPGVYTVSAEADGVEAVVEVHVVRETAAPPRNGTGVPTADVPSEPAGSIRWEGGIVPQKWMSFYTKVLSPLVSRPGLDLHVSFSLPIDAAEEQQVVEALRRGLRELGMEDNLP